MTPPVTVVLTTVGDDLSARSLASALIERRLIACATLVPVASIYRWDGEVQSASEIQLILKTHPDGADRLTAAVAELHPYELPEILVLEADASHAYARWIGDEVGH